MKLQSTLLLAAVSLSVLALAPITRATAPQPEAGAAAAPEAFVVDGGHSSILFRIQHMNAGMFYGRFNEVEGKLTLDEAQPGNSSVEVTVQAASVDTNSTKRDQHVTSPDFLDAKQFPRLAFKSSKVEAKGGLLVATGTLEMHGAKKEVTIEIEKTGVAEGRGGGRVYGFHTTFSIDRTEFGMKNMVGPLGEEVVVMVGIEAKGA